MDLGKAEVLTEKALREQSPEGFENEFNRRAARLQNAIDDFADLISPPH